MKMSKKRFLLPIVPVLFAALLLVLIPARALADGRGTPGAYADNAKLYHVTDEAEILTADESSELEALAETVSQKHGCGVYIITVPNYTEFGFSEIGKFSEWIYDTYTLGVGSGRDAVILVLSMANRDYDLTAHGDFANYAFTDYGKTELADTFLDDFSGNNWYAGFKDYVNGADSYLLAAQEGNPVDITPQAPEETKPGIFSYILKFLMIPSIPGFIVASVQKGKMYSVSGATMANEYASKKGIKIRRQVDAYTHTTESRQLKHKENRSGNGGGTTVNSHGSSHHSGKF